MVGKIVMAAYNFFGPVGCLAHASLLWTLINIQISGSRRGGVGSKHSQVGSKVDFEQNKREVNKSKKSFSLVQKQTMAVMKGKGWKHGKTDERLRSSFEKTFTNSSIY